MNVGRSLRVDEERLSFVTKAPLERLAPHARTGHYPKGSCICSDHQFSEAAYFILSGACELTRILPDGQPEVLDTLGPGTAFGGVEESDLDSAPTTAVATTDCVILCISRQSLEELRSEANGRRAFESNGHGNPTGQLLQSDRDHQTLPRQIVSLAFLSEQLPASLISKQLAESLSAETGAAVVLVNFVPHEDAARMGAGARPELFLNGEFHMPPNVAKTEAGFYSLTLGLNSEPPTPPGISSLLQQLSRHFRYVLIQAPEYERSAPWLFEFLHRSNLAYIFHGATSETVNRLDFITRELRSRSYKSGVQLKSIACLVDNERIDGSDLLAQRPANPVHMFVHGCPARGGVNGAALPTGPAASFNIDIRRLAREIGGCLVGLALSSGAAKGFAHIGVIQVLEENGIEVDVVAGASMGAYIASLWAYGHDGVELEKLAREMEGRWALWSLIDPVFPPRQGFLRGLAVKKRLMRSIGTARFADLKRPLRVVAGNLATLERVVFSSGEVATAVHASMAVPGICVPVTIDGHTYIDGGVVDPLPVDVLREMGVSRVIAVDAIPTPERIRYGIEADRQLAKETRPRRFFRKALPLDQQLNYFARGNLFEILMRSGHGAQIRVAEASGRMADLVLHPEICDDRWMDCSNPGKFIALGREVAEKHVHEIKALAARNEVTHERNPAPEPVGTIA
jgi:NTE family protein